MSISTPSAEFGASDGDRAADPRPAQARRWANGGWRMAGGGICPERNSSEFRLSVIGERWTVKNGDVKELIRALRSPLIATLSPPHLLPTLSRLHLLQPLSRLSEETRLRAEATARHAKCNRVSVETKCSGPEEPPHGEATELDPSKRNAVPSLSGALSTKFPTKLPTRLRAESSAPRLFRGADATPRQAKFLKAEPGPVQSPAPCALRHLWRASRHALCALPPATVVRFALIDFGFFTLHR